MNYSVSDMADHQVKTENYDKPMFVPPRKRGSRSSNENLQGIGATNKTSPQTGPKLDPRANRKLHQTTPTEHTKIHSDSPASFGLRSLAYQKQSLKANSKSDDSDLNSDLSDYAHLNDTSNERSALNSQSVSSITSCGNNYVTMTGTVKRGRKKGQTLDMKVQMSREELDELEHTILSKNTENDDRCFCGVRKGLHILILSIILVPCVLIISAAYSFYMGTMTWYNILIYFSEKKTIFHKIFISPLLIIAYPFLISLSTVGLGIYSALIQISWYFDNWKGEIQDLEKGFYGWLCGAMDLEDCAPYEVVILTEVLPPSDNEKQKKQQFADTPL